MPSPGLVIFVLVFVAISARRLKWLGFDRPAAALAGAVACVVTGALAPADAIAAVDGSTLLLLFGVMGMGAFLAVDGFFDQLEDGLVAWARTPARLLGAIVWGSGLLAAFITNDAVCVLGAPMVVRLVRRHGLPPLPFLLAIATAANTGSVATLVGNPQNMLCGLLGGLTYRDHLLLVGPIALASLALNHVLLWLVYRRRLGGAAIEAPPAPPPLSGRALLTLGVIAAAALAYVLGASLPWTAASGFVVLMLLRRRDTRELWPRIDWSLLLFFSGLFVVVEGLMRTGAPAALFARFPLDGGGYGAAGWARLSALFLVGSNVVSNVPFILVVRDQMATLGEPRLAWELLAVASTFAGNLTLIGSVANIIVAEAGRDVGGIGFLEHLKVGLPLALATTLLGTTWLVLVAG